MAIKNGLSQVQCRFADLSTIIGNIFVFSARIKQYLCRRRWSLSISGRVQPATESEVRSEVQRSQRDILTVLDGSSLALGLNTVSIAS